MFYSITFPISLHFETYSYNITPTPDVYIRFLTRIKPQSKISIRDCELFLEGWLFLYILYEAHTHIH